MGKKTVVVNSRIDLGNLFNPEKMNESLAAKEKNKRVD